MSFIISKIVWVFLSPGNVLVLLLLIAGFMSISHKLTWQNWGRHFGFFVSFLLFLIAIFPVGDWMLLPLENHFRAEAPLHVDGIILLGGDESTYLTELREQPVVYNSASRYIHFVDLSHKYPEAKLVFSGGSGLLTPLTKTKDSDVARDVLKIMGVSTQTMIFENQSRNTYENAIKTAEIIHPEPSQNWLLVTSAWHMPRSVGCFRKAGWNVYPQPTNYMTSGKFSLTLHFNFIDNLSKLNIAIHEYFGLLAYWLMNKTDKLWP